MNLCVIPARGGSKRIPRKNIKNFCGKPMISWSIEAAQKSSCFNRIIVSTDDQEIAAISKELGAEVPFIRSAELSDDNIGINPVMSHAIDWAIGENLTLTAVCCLFATAPFVEPEDLRAGMELLLNKKADYTFSVTSYAYPIQRALLQTKSGGVKMFQPEYYNSRSQDLEKAWHDAGQFYWGRPQSWIEQKQIFSESSLPVILPSYRVQDIDTHEDWIHAELLHKSLHAF